MVKEVPTLKIRGERLASSSKASRPSLVIEAGSRRDGGSSVEGGAAETAPRPAIQILLGGGYITHPQAEPKTEPTRMHSPCAIWGENTQRQNEKRAKKTTE